MLRASGGFSEVFGIRKADSKFCDTSLRLSNFIAHKTLLILCCNGKENKQ
jgi:hypothetical protein